MLQAAAGQSGYVEIYGEDYTTRDGTCVRDYIHVLDLARAHILALQILDERSAILSLGCGGEGYSVREVIDVANEITGREIPIKIGSRRCGDPAVLIASSEKIKRELGWAPAVSGLAEDRGFCLAMVAATPARLRRIMERPRGMTIGSFSLSLWERVRVRV